MIFLYHRNNNKTEQINTYKSYAPGNHKNGKLTLILKFTK